MTLEFTGTVGSSGRGSHLVKFRRGEVDRTQMQAAAMWILRQRTVDSNDVRDWQPWPAKPFEEAYRQFSMEFTPDDVDSVEWGPFPDEGPHYGDPTDEVRIHYWFGNSNLYHPVTQKEWEHAVDQVWGD